MAVRLIYEREVDPARHRQVREAADLAAGRAVWWVAPLKGPRPAFRAREAREAFGRSPVGSRGAFGNEEARAELLCQGAAEGLRHFYVLDAQELHPVNIVELLTLTDAWDCETWLIHQGAAPLDGTLERLDAWGVQTQGYEAFKAHLATLPAPSQHAPEGAVARVAPEPGGSDPGRLGDLGVHALPGDSFLAFVPACRAVLEPSACAQVEQVLARRAREAAAWMVAQPEPLADSALVEWLMGWLVGSDDVHALVQVRAMQLAAFVCLHKHVKVDPQRLLSIRPAADELHVGPEELAALRSLRQQRDAAMAACQISLRGSMGQLAALDVSDVAADGSWIDSGGERVQVRASLRSLLAAHRLRRLMSGAGLEEPYLAAVDGAAFQPPRLPPHVISRTLQAAGRDCGLALTPRRAYAESTGVSRHRLRSVGLEVRAL